MSAPAQIAPPGYPAGCEVDVALRDGSTLHVRPVVAEDRPAIERFLHALSMRSIGFRFFGQVDLDWAADWSTDVDFADCYALIATTGHEQAVVAHGAYVRTGPDSAEVAFTVADEWQGHGIATIMLSHLASAAEERGIVLFTAEVLPANHQMIQVFRDSGYAVEVHSADGAIHVEFPTSRSEQTRERFEQRERSAAIAAVARFLRPASVAVIGASPRRRTVGGAILANLRTYGFTGELYAVNRRVGTIAGKPAYSAIADVPGPVDLAVIAVPAAQVGTVAGECAAAGVHSLLVISAGFAETGREGAVRQRELVQICREAGMRLIGPNCLGVLNTDEDVSLDATFAERQPPAGAIGLLTQSGGLGIAIIEAARRLGLGLSSFVSVGNKGDISGNDLLEYWEQDPQTKVLMLYLESFGNPRRFARIARRVSRSKPIVAVKSGRSAAGARASASHTGALLSASDVTVDALFRQAGVIRTDTMQELFDVGGLLCSQPLPAGTRVAVVTNAGGPGIMCADACQAAGLDVVELPPHVRSRLAGFLAPEASLSNPIDMIATASAESYRRTIKTLVAEGCCDAIVAIFVPPLITRAEDVARAIRTAALDADGVAIATVFMNSEGAPPAEDGEAGVPSFGFPEDAARALGHVAGYGHWRNQPIGRLPQLDDVRSDEAAAILARRRDGWLAPLDVTALLDCYGLAHVATRQVSGPAEAAAVAEELGVPVALKAVAAGLVHKSDAGGVRLGLDGAAAVREAAKEIVRAVRHAGHRPEGLLVQPMLAGGVELLMGVVHDASFGPVIACGAGGTSVELLGDAAVRITPLTDLDAREMLHGLRTFPLLTGYRGAAPCDVASVEEMLLRMSAMVEEHPEISELDANPVVVSRDGATILDARIRVAAAPPRRPRPSL
jgi:acetyl coenzyme A synthetase (ADP forming)-like protein